MPIHPLNKLGAPHGRGGRGGREDVGVDQMTCHSPASRIGPRLRCGSFPGSSGADIRSRPKDGTRDNRCQSAKPRTTACGLPCRVITDARALRIPVSTLRNWEQGRVLPDPAARSLLAIVARNPKVALKALAA